ncbi:hypothetical protein ACOY5X_11955 [Enterobacter kobei]
MKNIWTLLILLIFFITGITMQAYTFVLFYEDFPYTGVDERW